jgi:pimeloyl-ACP methyl ester carboxylesterase
VGHSYGGIIVSGVADRLKNKLQHIIFLDALLVDNGQSWADVIPAEPREQLIATALASGGITMPVLSAAHMGVIDPKDAAWIDRRMVPHPLKTFTDRLALTNPLANGLPRTYIECTNPASPRLVAMRKRVRDEPSWNLKSLSTGHDAMVSAPTEVANIIKGYAL